MPHPPKDEVEVTRRIAAMLEDNPHEEGVHSVITRDPLGPMKTPFGMRARPENVDPDLAENELIVYFRVPKTPENENDNDEPAFRVVVEPYVDDRHEARKPLEAAPTQDWAKAAAEEYFGAIHQRAVEQFLPTAARVIQDQTDQLAAVIAKHAPDLRGELQHVLGNMVFALETDVDTLCNRTGAPRSGDDRMLSLVGDIRQSFERIKQFLAGEKRERTLREITDSWESVAIEAQDYFDKHVSPRLTAETTREEYRRIIGELSHAAADKDGTIRDLPGNIPVLLALAARAR